MSITEDFELCPKCKQGHLYPEGRAGVDLEAKGDFRVTTGMRDLICDHCGHRQKNAQLKEYGGPATEIVAATKAIPDGKQILLKYRFSYWLHPRIPSPVPL